ncbi:MAG: dipeptidase [Planctomycetota bacterium]
MSSQDLTERARALHQDCLVADLHTHMLLSVDYFGYDIRKPRRFRSRWNPLRNIFDLITIERVREGGLGLLVFAVYLLPRWRRKYRLGMWRQIEAFDALMARYKDHVEHARSVEDVHRIRKQGRTACMLAVEGGHLLERDLSQLAPLREKGAIYLTLTHFDNNALSGSATHPGRSRRRGLTALGRTAIDACNELGILVDVTHCSQPAKEQALARSRQPVIYSHTGLQRKGGPDRLTGDHELRAVARSGGVVGIMLNPFFLNGTVWDGDLDDVAAALAHIVKVAGPEHACIGSDMDSGLPLPRGLRDIGDYPKITEALLRHGLEEDVIRKIWGNNILTVLERAGW